MGTISLQTPVLNQPDTTEDVKVQNNFTTIQNVINGNIDSSNLSAATAQSAGVNQSGQVMKGAVNIATAQSTTSTTFTTLSTPDQVTVVLPVSGLIVVWYQAAWKESVAQTAQASLFLGSNQLQGATQNGPVPGATSISSGGPNVYASISSYAGGLVSLTAGAGYTADATTGQVVATSQGGPCWIFASPGTYVVSVQFRITGGGGGAVTAQNRKLWVQALSFA